MMSLLVLTKPPLVLCFLLIILATLSRGLYGIVFSKWVCYAVILIFLGGIIIAFLYVRRVTLDKKITIPQMISPQIATLRALTLLFFFNIDKKTFNPISFDAYIATFYAYARVALISFQIIYLLLALFTVVSFAESFKGAVRKIW